MAISTNGDIFVTGAASTTNGYPNTHYDMSARNTPSQTLASAQFFRLSKP